MEIIKTQENVVVCFSAMTDFNIIVLTADSKQAGHPEGY
jgi:hypothetical protein